MLASVHGERLVQRTHVRDLVSHAVLCGVIQKLAGAVIGRCGSGSKVAATLFGASRVLGERMPANFQGRAEDLCDCVYTGSSGCPFDVLATALVCHPSEDQLKAVV